MRCFGCNEIGHKKQDCPNSNAKGNNKRKNSPEVQCEYCARNGHGEQDCYLKAKHMRHREFVMSKNKSLNAKPSRREDVTTVQVFGKQSGNDTSSKPEEKTNPQS